MALHSLPGNSLQTESRAAIKAKIEALCLERLGEHCREVHFFGDTNLVTWFDVGDKRFRKGEGDQVRLWKGICPRCGVPLWSREFMLSPGSVRLATEDAPVLHGCDNKWPAPILSMTPHVHGLSALAGSFTNLSPLMRYKEVLIVGGVREKSIDLAYEVLYRGGVPRFLVRAAEEELIPEEIREACRVTVGDAWVRESAEMAAQGTSAIAFIEGPSSERNARIIRNLEHAGQKWGIRVGVVRGDIVDQVPREAGPSPGKDVSA